jgi:hypothetical protein
MENHHWVLFEKPENYLCLDLFCSIGIDGFFQKQQQEFGILEQSATRSSPFFTTYM